MTDYNLNLTGAQIDAALNKVHNADTSPVNGSTNMVTSDGVHDAVNDIQFANLNSNLVSTDLSSGNNNTTIPTTQAVQSYVDGAGGGKSLATGWASIAATGTAATDGFIVAYMTGDDENDAEVSVTVAGFTVRSGPLSGNSELENVTITMPIAEGETWSISGQGTGSVQRKFKALS